MEIFYFFLYLKISIFSPTLVHLTILFPFWIRSCYNFDIHMLYTFWYLKYICFCSIFWSCNKIAWIVCFLHCYCGLSLPHSISYLKHKTPWLSLVSIVIPLNVTSLREDLGNNSTWVSLFVIQDDQMRWSFSQHIWMKYFRLDVK